MFRLAIALPFVFLLSIVTPKSSILRIFCALFALAFLPGAGFANPLCSPNDNNARILSSASPNAVDPQWSDGYIGTGWSFYQLERIKRPTGVFAKGNLHGPRGGIAQKNVYVLLSEWTCQEGGREDAGGIEGIDAANTTPSFDCAEAEDASDRAICGDAELAALDRNLAAAYATAFKTTSSRKALREQQRSWLKKRSACEGKKECLSVRMTFRISELQHGRAEHEESPNSIELDTGVKAPPAAPAASQTAPQATTFPNAAAPLSTFRDCDHCPEMVVLPTGSYLMGAGPDDFRVAGQSAVQDELPQHRVTISHPIAFAKFELTVAEFAAYVDETGAQTGGECELRIPETGPNRGQFIGTVKPGAERYPGLVTVTDADFRKPGARVSERQPATCISRREAKDYLQWLSKKTGRHYRLPSESEWEYAARAGSTTAFYFGSSRQMLCRYGNFADRSSPYNASFVAQCSERPSPVSTAVVGSYQANAWGLFDMSGNVFEFTADCSSPNYNNAPDDGSPYVTPGCRYFVQRSYTLESMDTLLRSASRCAVGEEESRSNILGLRVAVDLGENPGDRASGERAPADASSDAAVTEVAQDPSIPLAAANDEPQAIITAIYGIYQSTTVGKPKIGGVFTKRLQALLDHDRTNERRLDYDVFQNGQDWTIRDVAVSLDSRKGEQSQVRVNFLNGGQKQEIAFGLLREDSSWRIDDVATTLNGKELKLSDVLGVPAVVALKTPSPDGEAVAPACVASVSKTGAEETIRSVYETFLAKNCGPDPRAPPELFTRRLRALLQAEEKTHAEDEKSNFDRFVFGQDFSVSDLVVRQNLIVGGHASVLVDFNSLGSHQQFNYYLNNEDGFWRIDAGFGIGDGKSYNIWNVPAP